MDFREISLSAVVHNLVALIKYAVLIVLMVAAFKWWTSRERCLVDSEDPGMRPAIKNTQLLVNFDREAWTPAELKRGDIAIMLAPRGDGKTKFPFRVVATEGEWVENDPHGYILVNGQKERYRGIEPEDIKPVNNYLLPRTRMPRGYFLIFTDNRVEAYARSPGLVPAWRVMGKASL